jgi:hypothetical protein
MPLAKEQMSAAAPPAAKKPEIPATATTPTKASNATLAAGWGLLALFPVVFLFVFHLGAGWLSYQKNGSMLWAVVNFIFAYFYYPYYAFFLSAPPAPVTTMMGGGRVHKGFLNKVLKWKA